MFVAARSQETQVEHAVRLNKCWSGPDENSVLSHISSLVKPCRNVLTRLSHPVFHKPNTFDMFGTFNI